MKYITSIDRCQGICAKNITHFCSSKTARAVRVWPPVSGSILCPPLFCPYAGRRVQEAAPYRCHGPRTGGHMGQYKSLSGECRRGRSQTGPCSGRPKGSPLRFYTGAFEILGGRVRTPAPTANLVFVGAGHWPARRCTRRVQEAAPYSSAPAATCWIKPGAEVEPQHPQFSTRPGPSGPAGI